MFFVPIKHMKKIICVLILVLILVSCITYVLVITNPIYLPNYLE